MDGRRLAAALGRRVAALAGERDREPELRNAGLLGVLAGLWSGPLRFDAADPRWPDRDRFVLSDGDLALVLHALLELSGVADAARIATFRHPLPASHPAIEAAAGLPGQGLAAATGMALAERAMAARFGRSLVDHRTWVLASATELGAGLAQEAASVAGELGLDRLAVLFAEPPPPAGERRDREETELLRRFAACGWTVRRVDGENESEVAACLAGIARARKPTLVAVQPPRAQPDRGEDAATGGEDEAALARWRRCGEAWAGRRRAWLKRLARHARRAEFEASLAVGVPRSWPRLLADRRRAAAPPHAGTLQATIACLEAIADADAPGRKLLALSSVRASHTFAHLPAVGDGNYDGRHLACGGREHGMAMLAAGLSLHGGTMPIAAAPTVAADRIRPALRLAAITGGHLVQLLTEDGLAARADSPVFQPLEQAASLRAIPGLFVFRPGCGAEASECLELALRRSDGPSVILLSAARQQSARSGGAGGNACARGAYLVADAAAGRRAATLIASGPELALALASRALLVPRGIGVAVVSLPCWELFARQPADYRAHVLGAAPRFGIEAACGFGWERWLGERGVFIGLGDGTAGAADGAGAADAGDLRTRAGLDPASIAATVAASL